MLYVMRNENNEVVGVSEITPTEGKHESRWDWKDFATVEAIAVALTAITGDLYVGCDYGASRSPRYDVLRAPKIGDFVSYALNGDYYPDSKIVSITPTLRVTTESGKKYMRRKQSGSWIHDGVWSMVQGHHDERNPSF